MAKLAGFKVPQQFMVGFIAGIFSTVLVWLASFIEPLAQTIMDSLTAARAGVVTGTDLGTKLADLLLGKVNLSGFFPEMVVAGIGGGLLVMVGTWIYNMDWSPDDIPFMKTNSMTKLTLVLFYASVLAALVLSAFAIPTVTALILLAVNSFVTAWFVTKVLGNLIVPA